MTERARPRGPGPAGGRRRSRAARAALFPLPVVRPTRWPFVRGEGGGILTLRAAVRSMSDASLPGASPAAARGSQVSPPVDTSFLAIDIPLSLAHSLEGAVLEVRAGSDGRLLGPAPRFRRRATGREKRARGKSRGSGPRQRFALGVFVRSGGGRTLGSRFALTPFGRCVVLCPGFGNWLPAAACGRPDARGSAGAGRRLAGVCSRPSVVGGRVASPRAAAHHHGPHPHLSGALVTRDASAGEEKGPGSPFARSLAANRDSVQGEEQHVMCCFSRRLFLSISFSIRSSAFKLIFISSPNACAGVWLFSGKFESASPA